MTGTARVMLGLLLTTSLPSLGGCGLSGSAHGPTSDAAAVVDMRNSLAFRPDVVRIKAGETVEWRNRSIVTHTVIDDPTRAKDTADARLPAGAQPFSAQVDSGEVYRRTFMVPGTDRYFCMPHEGRDMRCQVIVEPAT